jgi:hypothetical protein
MFGPGTTTCITWTSDRKAGPDLDQTAGEGWVLGWFSAASHYKSGLPAQIDSKGLLAHVDKYCAEHPLDKVHDACRTLVDELTRGKAIVIRTP